MKQLILLRVLLYISTSPISRTINYCYDASGNRSARDITLKFLGSSEGNKSPSDTLTKKVDSTQETEVLTDDIGDNSVLIYPNPTENQITVEIQDLGEIKGDMLYHCDQNGRMLLALTNIILNNTLELTSLRPWFYFMVIKLKNNTTKWNIVKE